MNETCSWSGQRQWGDDMQFVWDLVTIMWHKRTSCFTFVFLRGTWIICVRYHRRTRLWTRCACINSILTNPTHKLAWSQTVTAWIRLLHFWKRNGDFEKQHKERQISRLSMNTFLHITGMVLSCSDSEILFYLRVVLSILIPHIKIAIEYYDWFIRPTRCVAWFNLPVVTNTTGTRTYESNSLCGTRHYEFSV